MAIEGAFPLLGGVEFSFFGVCFVFFGGVDDEYPVDGFAVWFWLPEHEAACGFSFFSCSECLQLVIKDGVAAVHLFCKLGDFLGGNATLDEQVVAGADVVLDALHVGGF